MFKHLVFIISFSLLFFLAGCVKKNYTYEYEYNKILNTEPLQVDTNEKNKIIDNYTIIPIKKYNIAARVLKIERYRFDESSSISPVDFVLGWNKMSNLNIIKQQKIEINQSSRFYFWHTPNFNILSRDEIEKQSSNHHIIPSNKSIESYLLSAVKEGDLIYMEGFLVNVVNNKNQRQLNTSITRNDTGDGACEVLFVTKITHMTE